MAGLVEVASLIAGVATVAPALLKLFEEMFTVAPKERKPAASESILERRLRETAAQIKRQTRLVRVNWWASNVLRFGQYVIGGVLATAFVKDSLSANTVGLLGVLVLMASLIYQHFRPDVNLQECRARVYRLRRLTRRAEDELARAQKGLPNAKTEEEIVAMLSAGLNETDRLELTASDHGIDDTQVETMESTARGKRTDKTARREAAG